MRRPSEDYVQCWADLPEMYACAYPYPSNPNSNPLTLTLTL